MNYATGYALNVNELMEDFPAKKTKMTSKECEAMIGSRNKDRVASKVFKACIALVLDDIIENSDTFQLPTRSKKSEIYMKREEGDQFINARQNGKYQDVNFLNSLYSGYQMTFRYQNAGVIKEKPIYLDRKRRDRITELTNEGKSYY